MGDVVISWEVRKACRGEVLKSVISLRLSANLTLILNLFNHNKKFHQILMIMK